MNMYKTLCCALLAAGAVASAEAQTQCADGLMEIVVDIVSDNWPNEISWDLLIDGEVIAEGGAEGAVVCIEPPADNSCIQFDIHDSYGDGIYAPGGYWIYQNGTLMGTGNDYGYGETVLFDCPPGSTCNDGVALTAAEYGTVAQAADNFWYTFTPPANGMYTFSTCGSGCDTRLWIYDYCNMNNFDNTNEGSIYFDDNQGGCGEEAALTVLLEGGVTYWVRFANLAATCGGFDWTFNFAGPPTGCMDPVACNYSPLAEVDSGNCIYPGDPNCTGPDLVVVESAIVNSLSVGTLNVGPSDCYIQEGCLNGYGTRELVRFTTHIKNIGDVDYYIGPTASNATTQQFEWGDCHNHWHYKGYAEYVLFDMDGQALPIGFKNGFCVMDLECSDGGTAQYGCSNMGISAHCGDIYGSGLTCQWIDVTDVPDGQYRLVVRVNWDESPDALGRYENDYDNNWGVVCIALDRSTGTLAMDILEDCPEYVDCEGAPYGLAQMDCAGNCNGTALIGDLDANGAQQYEDAVAYVEHILGDDIAAAPCTDIDQDGDITVTDAALMSQCQFWNEAHTHPDSSGVHTKCDFPVPAITNPFDTVRFTVGAVNWEQGYLDIHVLNPDNRIVGYQFTVSGMGIASAFSLADPIGYPIEPAHAPGGQGIIGLSYGGESLVKNYVWTPLVRLYWTTREDEICLDAIVDVVNDEYHNTLTEIVDGCVTSVGVAEHGAVEGGVQVYPNPFSETTLVRFVNPSRATLLFEVMDLTGRVVRSEQATGTSHGFDRGDLPAGSYVFRLSGGALGSATGRFDIR